MLRIGALSERTGVSTHLLRVWEERYQLLSPVRSDSGYRLYTREDEERVREMMRLRESGVAAAEAAARVLESALARAEPAPLEDLLDELVAAFTAYDEVSVHAVVDRALVGHPIEHVVSGLFFPFLRRLGEQWEAGRVSVAQEHYASSLVRGRMMGLAPELGRAAATGPDRRTAVLACTPHERHDIGLLALDLLLRRDGWQVTFLGADTPVVDAVALADHQAAAVLVLCGTEPHMYAAQLEQHAETIASVRPGTILALAGRAATEALAEHHHATLLDLDPATAAAHLAELHADLAQR